MRLVLVVPILALLLILEIFIKYQMLCRWKIIKLWNLKLQIKMVYPFFLIEVEMVISFLLLLFSTLYLLINSLQRVIDSLNESFHFICVEYGIIKIILQFMKEFLFLNHLKKYPWRLKFLILTIHSVLFYKQIIRLSE